MRIERWLLGVVATGTLLSPGETVRPEPDSRPAVCFAPGTDTAYVERVYRQLQVGEAPAVSLFQFNLGNRWSSTATNGGGLGQGFPTTITWSVVPDGTFIPSAFTGDGSGPSTLRARLNALYGSEAVWQPIFQQAFDEWGSRTGTSYVFVSDDGASFSGSAGVLGQRGDVRISGRSIDGNSNILAYNFFPNNGDMVIDAPDSFYNDTSSGSLRLRNVVSHEHGHGLGIDHVCPVNQTKLMEPFFSASFVGPRHDDTLAGQRGYGDDRENNDAAAQGTNFGAVGNGTFVAAGGGLDDNSDLDFYRFTVTAGKQVDVTVTPVGATYLQGPQNQDGSCTAGTSFNSLIENNVALQVLASNGTTVLATASSNPAGVAETLNNVALTTAGQFFIRVSGPDDTVQLYNLSFTVEDQPAVADLAVTKTDGQATAIPGQAVTYTIVASNASATFAANAATVADTFPAALTGVAWTCAASAGSSCIVGSGAGNINRTVNLLPGGSVTFTATGTVAPGAVGTLANTATVSAPAGLTDPNLANNTATDTDTLTPRADLGITKTDGQASAVPGLPVTYTIVVSNPGPSTATGAAVTDSFPAAFTGVTWTCGASAGSSCAAPSGAGNVSTTVTLLPGGTATFSASGVVSASATGSLANTASVGAPAGLTDPNPANNTATDTDTLTPQADLGITKTDGQSIEIPGTSLTYAIVVSNPGPSTATGATVTDSFPPVFTGVTWTCVPSSGSACPAGGVGPISALVTLAPGGTLTFTASGQVSPSATGTLSNTASVDAPAGLTDPNPANNTATDTDTLIPTADVAVGKTDGQSTAVPGTAVTYTITALNSGPSSSGAATVTDAFPPSFTGVTWTCSASPGSACPASGAGNIAAAVSLAPSGTAIFTATGTVTAAATGSLSNTATVGVPAGVTDPLPANNAATDTDTLTPQADFGITKTDGQLAATPGAAITYTIQVTQGGPSGSPAATVADAFPAAITGVTWTCSASAGSSCPPSGSGSINTPVTLLPGGTATFSATGTVSAAATGTLTNTAQVTAPGGVTDPVAGNNSATDTDNLTLDMVELSHGSQLLRDLSPVGSAPADHVYWLSQKPYSSYEVAVDATSGDVGPTLLLERVAGDGSTVLQQSAGVSALGFSRSLRFVNDRPVSEDGQLVRVRSGSCGTNCGADDVYRIRLRETTGRIARFNNSTSQITVAILQNVSGAPLSGTLYFWRPNGTLAATQPFSLGVRATLVQSTASIPGLAGMSGAVTVAHDGGYGGLSGKTVALEPATGFSFDSPLAPVAW